MLNVTPVRDGAVLVNSLLNTVSMSVKSRSLLGTCDISYQMLSSASLGIFSEIIHCLSQVVHALFRHRLFMSLGADEVFNEGFDESISYLDGVIGHSEEVAYRDGRNIGAAR